MSRRSPFWTLTGERPPSTLLLAVHCSAELLRHGGHRWTLVPVAENRAMANKGNDGSSRRR